MATADLNTMNPLDWAEAAYWLYPAIERAGDTTIGEVESDLLCHMAQIWLAIDDDDFICATLITQRQGDNLHLWLCGGMGCDWRDLFERVKVIAKCDGIKTFSCDGRRGWRRLLKGVKHG